MGELFSFPAFSSLYTFLPSILSPFLKLYPQIFIKHVPHPRHSFLGPAMKQADCFSISRNWHLRWLSWSTCEDGGNACTRRVGYGCLGAVFCSCPSISCKPSILLSLSSPQTCRWALWMRQTNRSPEGLQPHLMSPWVLEDPPDLCSSYIQQGCIPVTRKCGEISMMAWKKNYIRARKTWV